MDFYNERLVKRPQKEHRCSGCCKKMPTNRKHWYISGRWIEGFYTARLCFACMKHYEKYAKDYSEFGWSDGDLKEGRTEVVRSWEWGRERKKEA